jgi:hypothetical protein
VNYPVEKGFVMGWRDGDFTILKVPRQDNWQSSRHW